MPPLISTLADGARASWSIRPDNIVEVLCHRQINEVEEYLVRWRSKPVSPVPPRAFCSWHVIGELYHCLHHVQRYIESRSEARPVSRKRKSPHPDSVPQLTANWSGFLTPDTNVSDRSLSPSPSLSGSDAKIKISESHQTGPRVYNGILQKKEGWITAKAAPESRRSEVVRINCTELPSPAMREAAAVASVSQAEAAIRSKFLHMLKPIKEVQLENKVDRTTPSLDFTFITDYVYREGVIVLPPDAVEGCDKCRPDMGQNIGCEYTQKCGCLEYAAVDEPRLERAYPDLHAQYMLTKQTNTFPPDGLPKRFPYSTPNRSDPSKPQTLVSWYLEERYAIYECNPNCRCGPRCKSRVVQKGRHVGLTIFKTPNRGWGVFCNEDLIKGEFIDTYLGEVITNEEANRREDKSGKGAKASYLYALDKFVGDPDPNTGDNLTQDSCHVVDGQYMGGPTRFINHSCEPNCRQYTVSYNKNDNFVYQLAFFAYEDIPKGTELTFDYMDNDEEEEEDAIRKREEALRDPNNKDKILCNCGSKKCRGFLWVKDENDQE